MINSKDTVRVANKDSQESILSIFLAKACKIHRDNDGNQKYKYDLVDYKNSKIKVKIICPTHGVFEQSPTQHISGQGCNKCGRANSALNRIKTQDEVINELKAKWHNNLDFSLVKYKNCSGEIIIICPKHGKFNSTTTTLLQGHGCKDCSLESRTLKRTYFSKGNEEKTKQQCEMKLGDNYEIKEIESGNTKNAKLKIYCKKHKSEQWQKIIRALEGRIGCDQCSYEERSRTRHKNFADINECLSKTNSQRILKILNEWNYEKNNHLSPDNLTEGSDRIVWWKCSDCGHEYQMSVRTRFKKRIPYCEKCNPTPVRGSLPSNIIFYELKKILSDTIISQEYSKEFKRYSWDMRIEFHDRHIVFIDYDGRYHLKEKNRVRDKEKNNLGIASGGEVWRIVEYSSLSLKSNGIFYTIVDGNRFLAQAKIEIDKVFNDLLRYFKSHLTKSEKQNIKSYLPLSDLQNEIELYENFGGYRLSKELLYNLYIVQKKSIKEVLIELDKIGKSFSRVKLMRDLRHFKIKLSKKQRIEIQNRLPSARRKPISQWSLERKHIADYKSISEAKRLFNCTSIGDCVLGKIKTAKGFLWTPKGILPKL